MRDLSRGRFIMLLDTSGLMCLFDRRDLRHASANKHYDSATRRLVHNYVFAEFVALAIARRAPLADALRFIEAIHGSDEIKPSGWIHTCTKALCGCSFKLKTSAGAYATLLVFY